MAAGERMIRHEPDDTIHLANVDVIKIQRGVPLSGSAYMNLALTPSVFSVGCIIYPFNRGVYVRAYNETDSESVAIAYSRLMTSQEALKGTQMLCDDWEQEYPNGGVSRNIAWYSTGAGGMSFYSFDLTPQEGSNGFSREDYERVERSSKKVIVENLFEMKGLPGYKEYITEGN